MCQRYVANLGLILLWLICSGLKDSSNFNDTNSQKYFHVVHTFIITMKMRIWKNKTRKFELIRYSIRVLEPSGKSLESALCNLVYIWFSSVNFFTKFLIQLILVFYNFLKSFSKDFMFSIYGVFIVYHFSPFWPRRTFFQMSNGLWV